MLQECAVSLEDIIVGLHCLLICLWTENEIFEMYIKEEVEFYARSYI